MANYAKELRKETLVECGVTNVTTDGRIFKGEKEVKQLQKNKNKENSYLYVCLYSPELRQAVPIEQRKQNTGEIIIDVHRAVYCWFNNIIPEGMVVDHINDIKYDNRLENLQLLTPQQNINKSQIRVREIKQPLRVHHTKEQILEKLNYYKDLYERAKAESNAEQAHKWRSYLSIWNAKLRYYEEHPEEYREITFEEEKEIEAKKSLIIAERNATIKQLKTAIKTAHEAYNEATGSDKGYYRLMWKDRINDYKTYIKNNPRVLKADINI